jgi:hypothetical protein
MKRVDNNLHIQPQRIVVYVTQIKRNPLFPWKLVTAERLWKAGHAGQHR